MCPYVKDLIGNLLGLMKLHKYYSLNMNQKFLTSSRAPIEKELKRAEEA